MNFGKCIAPGCAYDHDSKCVGFRKKPGRESFLGKGKGNTNQRKARKQNGVSRSREVPHAIEIEKTQTRYLVAHPRHLAKTKINQTMGANPNHMRDHVLPMWKLIETKYVYSISTESVNNQTSADKHTI